MRTIQGETGQSANRKKMEGLYHKYIALAREAKKREDHVLSEGYYQRAEYYLHAINEPGDSVRTQTRTPPPSVRKSSPRKSSPVNNSTITKVIENFNLKKTSHEKPLSRQPNAPAEESDPPYQAIILPFKGGRNQREIQCQQETME